jgi:hypothetical protein
MSWFARIEEACAAFIEQTFARSFPTDVEPAQIARKLVSTMEARTVHEGDRATAPAGYTVRVNTDDFHRLQPHRQYLEEEWAALLRDMANLVSIRLEGPVEVRLAEDPGVVAGAVEIDAGPAGQLPIWNAEPSPGDFVLRMVRGLPLDAIYEVRGAVTIGRSKANDIVIADPRVSRQHARIERGARGSVLIDLESTNGTTLNGARINGRVALRPGNVITLGNTELRFEERAP